MHPLRSRQGIAWDVELHLPSAPLALGEGNEGTRSCLQQVGGWKHGGEDGEGAGGFLQLIPPMPGWGHPALVAASEPDKGM